MNRTWLAGTALAAILIAGCDAEDPQAPTTPTQELAELQPETTAPNFSKKDKGNKDSESGDDVGTECTISPTDPGTLSTESCPTYDPSVSREEVLDKLLADPVARDGVKRIYQAQEYVTATSIEYALGVSRYEELRNKPAEDWTQQDVDDMMEAVNLTPLMDELEPGLGESYKRASYHYLSDEDREWVDIEFVRRLKSEGALAAVVTAAPPLSAMATPATSGTNLFTTTSQDCKGDQFTFSAVFTGNFQQCPNYDQYYDCTNRCDNEYDVAMARARSDYSFDIEQRAIAATGAVAVCPLSLIAGPATPAAAAACYATVLSGYGISLFLARRSYNRDLDYAEYDRKNCIGICESRWLNCNDGDYSLQPAA